MEGKHPLWVKWRQPSVTWAVNQSATFSRHFRVQHHAADYGWCHGLYRSTDAWKERKKKKEGRSRSQFKSTNMIVDPSSNCCHYPTPGRRWLFFTPFPPLLATLHLDLPLLAHRAVKLPSPSLLLAVQGQIQDFGRGSWAKNLLKIGFSSLKLPENCMIFQKILGAGPPGPPWIRWCCPPSAPPHIHSRLARTDHVTTRPLRRQSILVDWMKSKSKTKQCYLFTSTHLAEKLANTILKIREVATSVCPAPAFSEIKAFSFNNKVLRSLFL